MPVLNVVALEIMALLTQLSAVNVGLLLNCLWPVVPAGALTLGTTSVSGCMTTRMTSGPSTSPALTTTPPRSSRLVPPRR